MDIEALEFADALSSTTLDQTATWWPATEKQGFAGANWGPHCQARLRGQGKKQRKPRGERKAGKPPAPVLNHPAPLQPRRPGSGCPCLAPVCPADYRSHDARTMRRGPSCNGYHEPNGGPRIKQRWDSSDRAQLPFDPSESAGCFLVQRQAEGLEPGPELSHSSHGKGSFFSL